MGTRSDVMDGSQVMRPVMRKTGSVVTAADANHGAKQMAKELAKLFVEQGWIAQEQADRLFWDR